LAVVVEDLDGLLSHPPGLDLADLPHRPQGLPRHLLVLSHHKERPPGLDAQQKPAHTEIAIRYPSLARDHPLQHRR
jgi:hypothetical protein